MLYCKNVNYSIQFPKTKYQDLLKHCQRKLDGNYLANEKDDLKAFGLIGGSTDSSTIHIISVAPLFKNARGSKNHKRFMDEKMKNHAIPSVTPFEERGWVADQQEIDQAIQTMHEQSCSLIGTYHMHRVAWDHDPTRDTPTDLDLMLGQDSRMLMFIISMVDPSMPIIKAFFEGVSSQEIPIRIVKS